MHIFSSKQNKGENDTTTQNNNNIIENGQINANKPMTKEELTAIVYLLSEALFETEPEVDDIDFRLTNEKYRNDLLEFIEKFSRDDDCIKRELNKDNLDEFLSEVAKTNLTRRNDIPYDEALEVLDIIYPELIKEHISEILDDESMTYEKGNKLLLMFIKKDPSIVYKKIPKDKRKYRAGGVSRSFEWGDEKDKDKGEEPDRDYDYAFKQILFQASYGSIFALDNLFDVLREAELIKPLLENNMFSLGKERANYNVFNSLYHYLTRDELIKYNDKIMGLLKDCSSTSIFPIAYRVSKINALKPVTDRDRYYIDYHKAKEEPKEQEELVVKNNGALKPNTVTLRSDELLERLARTSKVVYGSKRLKEDDNKSLLELNYNEMMRLTSLKRRADLFMLALCDKDIDEKDLARSMYHLRREDIECIIGSLLKEDYRFLITPKYTNTFDYTKIKDRLDYTYLKERFINIVEINKAMAKEYDRNDPKSKNYSIFNNVILDEIKLKDTPYARLLNMFFESSILDSKSLARGYNKSNLTLDEKLNLRLLEYERMNLVKILSCDSSPKKIKALRGIIDNLITARDIKEEAVLPEGKGVSLVDEIQALTNKSPFTYGHKKTDEIYKLCFDEIIREYYKSIGVDYDKLEVNKKLDKHIRYGIEIEEINVSDRSHGAKACNSNFTCKTEYTINPANKDDNNQEDLYKTVTHSGEFISEILSASSEKDLRVVYEQMQMLEMLGGTTNSSCGMHIHVSDNNTMRDMQYIAGKMSYEVYHMQDMLTRKLCCYDSRISKTARTLSSPDPDYYNRYYIVNMASLTKHGSIEFRLFNMPDSLDRKVVDSYIDFATCFYDKIKEGYDLTEILAKAVDEENYMGLRPLDKEMKYDIEFRTLLETLEVKEDTYKVLTHLDEIFELYAAKDIIEHEEEFLFLPNRMNYYDKLNLSICHEEEIEQLDEYDSEVIKLAEELELYDSEDYLGLLELEEEERLENQDEDDQNNGLE